MSDRLPIITPRQLVRVLKLLGFEKKRQRGSHAFFFHEDGRHTTVSIHSKDIKRSLLRKVLRDIRLSEDKLKDYL